MIRICLGLGTNVLFIVFFFFKTTWVKLETVRNKENNIDCEENKANVWLLLAEFSDLLMFTSHIVYSLCICCSFVVKSGYCHLNMY